MYNLNQVQEITNKALREITFNSEPSELYDPIKYALSVGGKRLRPALTLMACNLYTEDVQDAIAAALGLEIFHNFTLLHDDIMDNSDIRRNNPTVHKKWNANIAILSGDAMAFKAYDLMLLSPADKLKKVLQVYNKTALQVCEGQQYDMNYENLPFVTEEDYLRMISLKTSVLLAASLKIGAIIGGADQQDADLIYDFGINIGLAFQLQDDLLDVYGDTKIFGKQVGKDILANKKTFMYIKALSLAKGEELTTLRKYLQLKEYDPEEKVKVVTGIYNNVGIRQLTELKINYYFSNAMDAFEKINIKDERKQELKIVVDTLMNRIK